MIHPYRTNRPTYEEGNGNDEANGGYPDYLIKGEEQDARTEDRA